MSLADSRENASHRIALFGQFSVRQADRTITRFRTKKAAELLAYLACYRHRQHAREALLELLWPDEDIEAARNRLSVELNSLRRQLEPPGVPTGAVLRADRTSVQLNPDAYTTDVAEFEAALQAGGQAEDDTRRASHLMSAVDLYRGELLPGYYAEWVQTERERLADAYFTALRQLTGCLVRLRRLDQAIDYARRAVQADPLREASYRDLMRLYSLVGRPSAALELYRDLERLLQEAVGAAPSAATQELAQQAVVQAGGEPDTGRAPAVKPPAPSPPTSSVTAVARTTTAEIPGAPVPARTGSLPMQFTRFFGREEESAALQTLLCERQERLVTLSGPGGTGKTRLSIEVGRRLKERFPGGVWFVPLADLWDARLIAETIRDTLGLSGAGNVDPIDLVVEALSSQPALLILDNFEQLAAGGAPVVRTLLKRVESLQCLVSSRRTLRLAGEREFPVSPLPLPQQADMPEQLLQVESVQLFVDRAQAVRPDFQLTQSNGRDVAALCEALEGIPLAIELAAARAKSLSPAQMRERLAERFELLATRRMDKGARHRSLWAAIDWSYHLLPPALQQFFARLSVFRGGWTLEAAEAVCQEPLALDYLAQLQGHSLVSAEESAPDLQFRMLESLREFAEEQLLTPEALALGNRHSDFYVQFVEQAEPQLYQAQSSVWLNRLEAAHDNLRAALNWSLAQQRVEEGLRLIGALCWFWELHGHLREGRRWAEQLLAQSGGGPAVRAKALSRAGNLAYRQSDYTEAAQKYEQGLDLFRQLGNRQGEASTLKLLGNVAFERGENARARTLYADSLALYRELQQPTGIAYLLDSLGNLAQAEGDYISARPLHEESVALLSETGEQKGLATALLNLGCTVDALGDSTAARAILEESLTIRRTLGDKAAISNALQSLGRIALQLQDYARADALMKESLDLVYALGRKREIAYALSGLAHLAAAREEHERASRLWGADEALRVAIAVPLQANVQEEYDRSVAEARAHIGEEAFASAWEQGRAMTLEEAVHYALRETES